jgi:hypothetical protein
MIPVAPRHAVESLLITATCGDVNVRRAHLSAYGREQSRCANANGCADGCE